MNVINQNPAASAVEPGFSEEFSLQYCQEYLENSTAVQHCLSHLKYDAVNESIRNCVEDLMVSIPFVICVWHASVPDVECVRFIQVKLRLLSF